jgi:hypothetical protein
MSDSAIPYQLAFSICVIVFFGYRQFNQWTEAETRSSSSDVELLAFAKPRSFTSLWRFLSVASLYCTSLVVLYFLLWTLFSSPPTAGMAFLQVSGVSKESAWLVALFVVTGLSPILPVLSNVERNLREVMHAWAVVPTKAQELANELASPDTTFDIDERFFLERVAPRVAPHFGRGDLTEGAAATIAQKWCRLKFLISKYAPPRLDEEDSSGLRSPYTTRFHNDLMTLQKDLLAFAADRENASLLRSPGGTPGVVSLLDRIDSMLHRLYVLMCCRAFESEKSVEEVVEYLRRSYGIGVGKVELAAFPTDPIFDTLVGVTVAVFGVSFAYTSLAHNDSVHPVVWALSAFATHGLGLLVGWLVFSRRRRRYRSDRQTRGIDTPPLSRKLLLASTVLGFALATIPTWVTTVYQLQAGQPAGESLLSLLSRAFLISWPWAFLGSATAIAVYVHLERTSNRAASWRLRTVSAGGQALTNVVIALLIFGLHPSDPTKTLAQTLDGGIPRLVLLLTGTIGLVLGFFLPRVVHGHGFDLRGGAIRYRPEGDVASAVFTVGGRQVPVRVREISLTGGLLLFASAGVLTKGRQGTLVLSDGTRLQAHFVRHVEGEPDSNDGAPVAVQFIAPRQGDELSSKLRLRLNSFLKGPSLTPAV